MTISNEYKQIGRQQIITRYPKYYYPNLTNSDYKRGWINRYFVRLKSNKDSPIIEISEMEYKRINNESFTEGSMYNIISLRWKISGNIEEIQLANTRILESKEQIMPNISLMCRNRLQFWKK